MKLKNFVKTLAWIFFSLLTAARGAYAQEVMQKAQQSEVPVAKESVGVDTYEKLLRDADSLIRSGKPAAAYNLLEPHEFKHSGKVRFDYLLGIAALDSGKPDLATLAFERVLTMDPDFTAARLDMARAYYQMGDLQRARTEFAAVLKLQSTDDARANIQKYLDSIDARKEGKQTSVSGYVEGGFGRDSNVNNSTSQSQIQIFDSTWTTATLDSTNIKAADNYYSMAAGGEINHGLNANWGLYAGGDLRKRGNNARKQFDTLELDARAGIMFETKSDRIRLGVLGGRYKLGGLHNSDTSGVKGEWRHVFSPGNQMNMFVQSAQYRYVDPIMQPNDFDQRVIGLGWMHVFADGRSSLSGSVHYGEEKDVSPIIKVDIPPHGFITANPSGGRNDGAKRFRGLRVGGQSAFNERTMLFARAGMQVGEYNKFNAYFQRQRNDRLYDLTMGVNRHWDKQWTLLPQLRYFKNDSNIVIYSYNRMDVSLTVRRDFR